MKVCICGSGSLGHVCAAVLSSREGVSVSLLSRKPDLWADEIVATDPDGKQYRGCLDRVSSSAQEVIPGSDLVLLCLPGFAIRPTLEKIKPFVDNTPVGSIVSSSGFFFEAMDLLPETTPLFGFQRVPFIARLQEYGHSAALLGYKPKLFMAVEQTDDKESLRATVEQLLDVPVVLLASHYEVSLTNSNPLLHPSRLYTMWKDWHEDIVYPSQSLFYEEWTNEASELLIAMDREFFQLLKLLPVREGSIPSILDYYESKDAPSLTRKLRSIQAFKGILSPMKPVEGGFIPDFQSRYFTEDFPYGLRIIRQQAERHQLVVPIINKVLAWGLAASQSVSPA